MSRPLAALLVALTALLGACTPTVQQAGPPTEPPSLAGDSLVMPDGTRLPLRVWLPAEGAPRAVVLALHGFNDYSAAFEGPARDWAAAGVATYAYDQRGFGAASRPGIWPGQRALIDDLRTAAALVRARHPGTPFYLLGESMGGAVVMAAMVGPDPPQADGVILVAPAVWGRQTQGPLETAALWLATHLVPWMTFTGEGLHIQATDNIELLRRMSRDPLVIKATRVDAINGLVNLMDTAYDAAARLKVRALILYGSEEQVMPAEAILSALRRLPPAERRIAIYPTGYHMLLRDLNAGIVRADVLAWIEDPDRPLPSGAEQIAERILSSGRDSLKLEEAEKERLAALPALAAGRP
ncbi:MAG: alpha/beta hydrolase [Rhodospirillaceae bacterium]|nr:alpha/beta hydrolase [Rhodospirillaceae bacterium]